MIRDKQVLEKRMIQKELEEEEKRLDKMLEMEREKGMKVQEELERCRKQELIRWAQGSLLPMEESGPFQPHQPCPCSVPTMGNRLGLEGTLLLSYSQSQAAHCEADGAECRGARAEG